MFLLLEDSLPSWLWELRNQNLEEIVDHILELQHHLIITQIPVPGGTGEDRLNRVFGLVASSTDSGHT